jgi:hypothetical protein
MFVRASYLEGTAGDQIIDNRLFPLHRSKDSSHALYVFAGTLAAAYYNRDVGCRHINALVQNTGAYQDSQFACAEPLKRSRAFAGSYIAGDRLNEMFSRHRIRGIVIRREY